MSEPTPVTDVCPDFSSTGAPPVPWGRARAVLTDAPLYWVTTVRPDGRPHAVPLLGVWVNGSVCFCTGREERKALNLAANPHCAMSTGDNRLEGGPDVIVEGTGAPVDDPAGLDRIAEAYEHKYGTAVTAEGGTWYGLGDSVRENAVLVVRVTPAKAFAFGKAPVFSQTRYTFP
ncbi:pyridoxamine 5'-phosphate oxidase [Nocardiopsis terrae]|uniref:Nitroimidazol reductase NimA-like FMN-containing flavoprotein (Pyridoxamine 5'-phosphate oxidase superfamily) n=1 Tax=Nocardiopsis terrae TaxID=372655 RepID=A0ABR9HMX3_9ACTN|nr:pyridoxamine 5'-phosphate oxidase family protein [Nocardiopsis terrae]MBE1460343.1 nitroimidazol reductase NimA-like FMN-containing flavoprotein (pyridoxamine 5'-phosphate oxidase superfamily) [Nocardiopsis terrae]GHC70926.1 pyridoxamine 5'-phosphate oxidase [Nocardiopsis terrae]